MNLREEIDHIAIRLRMLSCQVARQDSKRMTEIAYELWAMIDRLPTEVDANYEVVNAP